MNWTAIIICSIIVFALFMTWRDFRKPKQKTTLVDKQKGVNNEKVGNSITDISNDINSRG
jgi:hypothetical protein